MLCDPMPMRCRYAPGMNEPARVLVTGATGQLGVAAVGALQRAGFDVVAWSHRSTSPVHGCQPRPVDLGDRDAVANAWLDAKPDAVVHAGAVTSIAAAAADPATAVRINVDATTQLATLASAAGARMLYLSTDMVFDGETDRPYRETDAPAPTSVYGRTKLEGERAVLDMGAAGLVLRSALVLGRVTVGPAKFFDQLVARLQGGESVTLFDDEWRTPVNDRIVGSAIAELLRSDAAGVFHVAGAARVTRYDLGLAVAAAMGADASVIQRASRLSVGGEPRPRDLSLDTAKLASAWKALPRWDLQTAVANALA